jgi:2-hydroxy-3-oxopropionate reductase
MGERIGFIGLGVMGKPMARNLLKGGFELVIHNRSRGAIDELMGESPSVSEAGSPKEVAEQASIVITVLPDSPDVEAVALGENGLIHGMSAGSLLIDMSTITPQTAITVNDRLQEIGASALDAPISGGERGAINGTLSIMAGGSEADFERARPVFEAMGTTIVHCGPSGSGQTVKSCNQILSSTMYAAISETLVYGSKAGVDPETIIKVLSGGSSQSRLLETKGPTMVAHQFDPGFRVELMRKDLAIAQATAKANHAPLPISALVTQMYDQMLANGINDRDHSIIITLFEEMANHKVRS